MSGGYVLSVSAYSTVYLHSEVHWAYTEMGIVDRGRVILKSEYRSPHLSVNLYNLSVALHVVKSEVPSSFKCPHQH